MRITRARIPDVLLLETPVYRDGRGYFQETYRRDLLLEAGIDRDWKQDNISVSAKHVIRGLHYQTVKPQAKLIRVLHGSVFDAIVDIRRSSPTYGLHVTVELHAGDGRAVFIPEGFAHGFAALEPDTAFFYKVSETFYPQGDRTILWNDAEIGITWPIAAAEAIVSDKDRSGIPFGKAEVFP
jgi:dTDP-4-dehydrorhamnose 3,5-epimerase